MSDENPGEFMPQPTDEHRWIQEHVGTWKVDCKFFMDPSQPPMQVEATETVEAFGPFYIVSRFDCEMFGAPFQGMTQMGYDVANGCYVSTWIDSVNSFLYHFTGHRSEDGKTLEFEGRAPDPMSKQMTDWRTTEVHADDGSRTFEMFMTHPGSGQEIQLLTHVYRRA